MNSGEDGLNMFMICRKKFAWRFRKKTAKKLLHLMNGKEPREKAAEVLPELLQTGNVIEKGGVNTSVVYGKVTDKMRKHLKIEGSKWFACGLSLVIHPVNPYVPTVHANWRYFELYDEEGNVMDRWFGGGTDLTPYYLFEEDAKHFHQTIKNTMDQFGSRPVLQI